MSDAWYSFRAWLSTRLLILTLFIMPDSRTRDEILDALQSVVDRRSINGR